MLREERCGRIYNDRVLLGDYGENFFDRPPEEISLDMGYSGGCPLAADLVRSRENGGRGVKEMGVRYGEVISFSQVLVMEDHVFQKMLMH